MPCVCGLADFDRFMVECNACHSWFHGDCMKIEEHGELAKSRIREFMCAKCKSSVEPTPSSAVVKVEKRCNMCIGCRRPSDCGKCGECTKGNGKSAGCLFRKCVNTPKSPPTASSQSTTNRGRGRPSKADMGEDNDTSNKYKTSSSHKKKSAAASSTSVSRQNSQSKRKSTTSARSSPKEKSGVDVKDDVLMMAGTRGKSRQYQEFMIEAGLMAPEKDSLHSDNKHHHHHHKSSSSKASGYSTKDKQVQCANPPCIYAARTTSKYCSDECGMALARARLNQLLPEKLALWTQKPSAANHKQEARRAELTQLIVQHDNDMDELTEEENKLHAWMLAANKSAEMNRIKEEDNSESESNTSQSKIKTTDEKSVDEHYVFCPVCGTEIQLRTLSKHTQKCYAKLECTSSYSSPMAATNPYDLFCHQPIKANNTFCKRLKLICPEHYKRELCSVNQICACPLDWKAQWRMVPIVLDANDIMRTDIMCTRMAVNCTQHYDWHRMFRASIGLRRMQLLFKKEELQEELHIVEAQLRDRGNVLGLLEHDVTYSNDWAAN